MSNRMTKRMSGICAAAVAALFLLLPSRIRANEEVFKKTLPSTVLVVSKSDGGVSVGTGVLVDAEKKLVATAHHVVQGSQRVVVFFPKKDSDGDVITDPRHYLDNAEHLAIPAEVAASAPEHDLSVLSLERLPKDAAAVPLAKDGPKPGQSVHAIGNSGISDDALWRYSPGKVRNVYNKRWKAASDQYAARVVETTLPANPGDSGGPVVNDQAQLVGITHGFDPNQQAVALSIEVRELQKLMNNPAPTPAVRDELFERAMKYKAQKEYAKAKELLLELLRGHPTNEKALTELAWILNEEEGYRESIIICYLALKLNDKNAAAWKELGYAFLMTEDYERAVKALAIAIELSPTDAGAHRYLAEALDGLGELELADQVRKAARRVEEERGK
jgi:hypothetical protein